MVRIPVLYPNEVDEGVAGGGAALAPFVAACHLHLNAAADTDLAPQIQVSEIVVAWAGPVAG